MLLEEGALEEYLAARAAPITLAAPERERIDHFLLAEIRADETAQLPLRLPRAKPRILHGAQTLRRRQTFFQQASLAALRGAASSG